MADPLSMTANIFAVVGFSVQSCNYLVNFFQRFVDAPAEVQHNVLWLQALISTFSELHALGNDERFSNAQLELPSAFNARLDDCNGDLLEIVSRVRRINQNLQAGRLVQTWTKVKFAFASDQWLAKFCQRLQMYQTTFTLDLMMIQIKLTVKSNQNQTGNLGIPPGAAQPEMAICTSCASNNHLTPFLDRYAEPVSVRSSTCYSLEICLGRFEFWSGPIFKQLWSNKQLVGGISSVPGEYGFGFQMYLGRRSGHKGISVVFVLMKGLRPHGSLSIRWNISFPQVIPREADIFNFVRTGNLAAVKSIFSMRKVTPLHTSPDGTSLLHIAAKSNSLPMVRLLLQEGADVNSRDEECLTALHFAVAESRNYDICRTLLEYGADIGSRDVCGKTPLHTFFNPIVGMLLINNRDTIDEEIMTPDTSGMTIIQYAAWSSKSGMQHLIPYLKPGEIYPFIAHDYARRSMLHFAAHRGNIAILEYLLSLPHEVGLDSRDVDGQYALHYAVQCKRTEAIDLLRLKGADVNAVDAKGRTVLHCAAARNNLPAIEKLVKICDSNILQSRDRDGRTPAELAHRRKAFKAARYLEALSAQHLDPTAYLHPLYGTRKAISLRDLWHYLSYKSLHSVHFTIIILVILYCMF